MRTNGLHASSLHDVLRKQVRTVFRAQQLLAWSDRQARHCLACSMVQMDAPGCSEDPAPPVRYRGVWLPTGKKSYWAAIRFQGKQHGLGSYATSAQAAVVYDEARIYLKRDPVNFPGSQYDEATIRQFHDFDTFIRKKRALTKRNTSSRFNGVTRWKGGKNSKWSSFCQIMGRQHALGYYATEELAAQAFDKVRIYQDLGAANFPEASYDVESIHLHKSIGSLVASIRAEASALTRATYTSRYTGVYQWAPGIYQAYETISNCRLGCFRDEEQAAMAYDQFCIYQGSAPVNRPDHAYNIQEICWPADLSEFVHRSREMAARLTKKRQTSRYTGVTWDSAKGLWRAYVTQGGKSVLLGRFASDHEEKAARLVDKHRQNLGQEIVNFPVKPIDLGQLGSETKAAKWVNKQQQNLGQDIVDIPLKSRRTPVGRTWPSLPAKQTKT